MLAHLRYLHTHWPWHGLGCCCLCCPKCLLASGQHESRPAAGCTRSSVELQGDPAGVPAQVHAGPLVGGTRAAVLFNRHTPFPVTSNITVQFSSLGYHADAKVLPTCGVWGQWHCLSRGTFPGLKCASASRAVWCSCRLAAAWQCTCVLALVSLPASADLRGCQRLQQAVSPECRQHTHTSCGWQATVRDLYARKDLGVFQGEFTATLPWHEVVAVKVTPQFVRPEYDHWRPWHQVGRSLRQVGVSKPNQSCALQYWPAPEPHAAPL